MLICSKFHMNIDPCKLHFNDRMQQGNNVGGLSGLWAPVDREAATGTRQLDSFGSAEQDPMHQNQPAGGAQKGRSRPAGEAGIGSAMTCVAHARLGAKQPYRRTRASCLDRHINKTKCASEPVVSVHAWTLLAVQLADTVATTANMHLANSGGSVEILDLAADGPTLAAGLSDGNVHVYSAATQILLYVSRAITAGSPITAVANSKQRNSFIAVAANGVRAIRDGSVDYTTMCGSFAGHCFIEAVCQMHAQPCNMMGASCPQGTSDLPVYCTGMLTPRVRMCTAPRSALTASCWQWAARAGSCSLTPSRSSSPPCLRTPTRKPSHRCAAFKRVCGVLEVLLDVFAMLACGVSEHTNLQVL